MIQGVYTASLGIATQQKRLDSIANNLANVNTTGYKTTRTDFKDALYSNMQRAAGNEENLDMRLGHGVLVSGTTKIFTPGQFLKTDSDTDCYIDGEGFFTVQTPQGQTYYTRNGNFARSVQADGEYLVTSDGYYVLDQNGQRVMLRGSTLAISPEGLISEGNGDPAYSSIGLVTFPNQEGLTAVSNNFYSASAASGQPQRAGADTKLIQKTLEGSNVNMADEFSRMIRSSRALQLSSRALSVADQMDGTANELRR